MSAQPLDWEECTVEPGMEERLLELIPFGDMVEAAVGNEALGTARRKLRELDATSAMDALTLFNTTAKTCDAAAPNHSPVRVAERMLRDVVVMFFVNRGGRDAVGEPEGFLGTAEDINGAPLDRET